MMKTCTVCGQSKELSEFYNYKATKDGKMYRCKSCDSKSRKKWKETNPERSYQSQRERNLKHKYGITLAEYKCMLDKQHGCCAICAVKENNASFGVNKTLNFAVDHCHTTGKVRGLLCNQCNRALGMLNDDIKLVIKALDYLQCH